MEVYFKNVQGLKVEIESIKNTQTKGYLQMKLLESQKLNLRSKSYQQNTRDRRENLRH